MIDENDAEKYQRRYPPWEKTVRDLLGQNISANPLLRIWWYDELEYLPTNVVLWRIARGMMPVRNFGTLGQQRLREALRAAGIPEQSNQTTTTISLSP